MGTVASELKSEREKRRITLAQIAAETRISLRHLESLEEGRFNDLPGGIYSRAFLRAYCETLNLENMQEIMQRYESELAPVSEKPPKSRVQIPQSSHSFHINPLVIWGIMLLLSATGLFFSRKWITAVFSPYFSHTPVASVPFEPEQPKPAQPSAPITAPAASLPAQPMPTPDATTGSSPTVQAPPPDPSQAQTVQTSPLPAATLPAAEVKPTPPPTPADAAKALRMEIDAGETCWVSVDRDGSPAFRKTMQPGDVQFVGAADKISLILGNAGGVRLKINGKPVKPLGKPGEVIKLLIDAKNLQEILDQTAG